jgi:hypothetical protein
MRIAVGALAATTMLGLLLAGTLTGLIPLPNLVRWVDIHAALGLLGWVGILIVGVAFQVIPMFYVTPEYPVWLKRFLAPFVIFVVCAGAFFPVVGIAAAGTVLIACAATAYALFAIQTIVLLAHSARRRLDATRLHWWAAMICMLSAAGLWALEVNSPLVGVLLLVGVGTGLPAGMLLKIFPFLCWFHLQRAQLASGRLDVRIPYMQDFVPERLARLQFAVHVTALLLLIAASMQPFLAPVGALALVASALLLEGLLLSAAARYRRSARALKQSTNDLAKEG